MQGQLFIELFYYTINSNFSTVLSHQRFDLHDIDNILKE